MKNPLNLESDTMCVSFREFKNCLHAKDSFLPHSVILQHNSDNQNAHLGVYHRNTHGNLVCNTTVAAGGVISSNQFQRHAACELLL